jgi:hypothetical protein
MGDCDTTLPLKTIDDDCLCAAYGCKPCHVRRCPGDPARNGQLAVIRWPASRGRNRGKCARHFAIDNGQTLRTSALNQFQPLGFTAASLRKLH